jgi:hypothetical protein
MRGLARTACHRHPPGYGDLSWPLLALCLLLPFAQIPELRLLGFFLVLEALHPLDALLGGACPGLNKMLQMKKSSPIRQASCDSSGNNLRLSRPTTRSMTARFLAVWAIAISGLEMNLYRRLLMTGAFPLLHVDSSTTQAAITTGSPPPLSFLKGDDGDLPGLHWSTQV